MTADRDRCRSLLNRVNGSTLLGLAVARVGGAVTHPGPRRLILAEGYRWSFPRAGAFTVGDVVISRHRFDDLVRRHPNLLAHEERHARQWARWGGLPFLPAYLASVGWSMIRTGDHWSRNHFERAADLADGGYREAPVRRAFAPLRGGVR